MNNNYIKNKWIEFVTLTDEEEQKWKQIKPKVRNIMKQLQEDCILSDLQTSLVNSTMQNRLLHKNLIQQEINDLKQKIKLLKEKYKKINNQKKVLCIETGEIFENVKECAANLGASEKNIYRSIDLFNKGKKCKVLKKYTLCYF